MSLSPARSVVALAFLMWTKICGITNSQDAATVVDAQADAIGLNFYPDSRRYVSPETARLIANEVRHDLELIGVFVNHSIKNVADISHDVGLTAVQFHGDERPDDVEQFQELCPSTAVIRAFRVGPDTMTLPEQWQPYGKLHIPLSAALVDAWNADEYGGTGQTVSANLLEGHQQHTSRLILAGGLTAANVAAAATMIQPWGVDTASGVEVAPGIKSEDLIRRFVAACRMAFPHDPPDKLRSVE